MKTIASFIAASATVLAGAMISPASAEVYPHTVDTTVNAKSPNRVRAGARVRVRINWDTSGNATPSGKVVVKIINKRTGKVVRKKTKSISGTRSVRFAKLRPSRYKIVVKAIAPSDSVFKNDSTKRRLRVVR